MKFVGAATYKDGGMSNIKEPYRCDNPDCDCNRGRSDEKHCPICGAVYMWNAFEPLAPCTECVPERPKG